MDVLVESIKNHKDSLKHIASLFSSVWEIPKEAYLASMQECLDTDKAIP